MMKTANCKSAIDGSGPGGMGINSKIAIICDNPKKNGTPMSPDNNPTNVA
jgi:hypothetical protein